jgi:hypothetical protein
LKRNPVVRALLAVLAAASVVCVIFVAAYVTATPYNIYPTRSGFSCIDAPCGPLPAPSQIFEPNWGNGLGVVVGIGLVLLVILSISPRSKGRP